MKFTWEDRKSSGHIDGTALTAKPVFSFPYAWFLVTDATAQFVESHDEGFYNEDMTLEQKQEVLDWYAAWTPPVVSVGPPPIPQQVTMRQARLALLGAGLLAGVDAAIAGLTEPTKSAAIIEWEYAAIVQRNSGLVPAMATALGMTEAQIDALFVAAAAL